jgi:hypothetical protein
MNGMILSPSVSLENELCVETMVKLLERTFIELNQFQFNENE